MAKASEQRASFFLPLFRLVVSFLSSLSISLSFSRSGLREEVRVRETASTAKEKKEEEGRSREGFSS